MHVEVSVALNFVISYLYNKLPRRRVDMFGEEVEKGLKRKFEGHWYPDMPFKGSGFRCMRVSGEKMDQVLVNAAHASGLDIEEIKDYLPKELTVWIDPHEVSYRIGEKGAAKILYSDKKEEDGMEASMAADKEVQNMSRGFNPEAQSFKPIDSLSSPQGNVSLSPSPNTWLHSSSTSPSHQTSPGNNAFTSTSPVNSFVNRAPKTTTFTAATFAQTKFGSTKLKTQAKRPSRLSPTEMGAFIKQRSGVGPWSVSPMGLPGGLSPTGILPGAHHSPHSLSPGDPRLDLLEHQQRMMMLQQLQQQQQMNSPMHPGSGLPSPVGATTPTMSDLFPQQKVGNIPSNGDLLSPLSNSIPNVPGIPGPLGIQHSPIRQPQQQPQLPHPEQQGTPSPTDPNKALVDSHNTWNSKVSPYSNLQHLLVAN